MIVKISLGGMIYNMKTYIMVQAFRRGNPTINFVDKDSSGCWLGTYHGLVPIGRRRVYQGVGSEYEQVSRIRITEDTYKQLKLEAKLNKERYTAKKIKVNDIVTILAYKNDPKNCRGRVNSISDGRYYITNMNMPFMGTINDWFTREEISLSD
jgi:hypothetical protein